MTILIMCAAISMSYTPVLNKNIDDGFEQPITDFMNSIPRYCIDEQTITAAEEIQSLDLSITESFEPVTLQKASHKNTVKELNQDRTPLEIEEVSEAKQTLKKKSIATDNEYYVQVGSWKNPEYAEGILMKMKKKYPDAIIVEQNNFYKVRIPGVMDKQQGITISKKVKVKFNMNPLLVLRHHKVSLADAVRPFIGISYTKINCYGLIVRGLINQGVQYHGRGGLREKLENLAQHDGLPDNAYLNGEGLVEKVGTKIFSKSILKVSDAHEKIDNIYHEMKPYLREGLVLSFSTPSRGHTGIVSRQKEEWTYINSGVIDNEIFSGNVSERVGEEFLKAEIQNWVFLAKRREEPLMVTLGLLNTDQLQDFYALEETNKLTALNIH